MIELKQDEIWAFNILSKGVENVQIELGRTVSARGALIKLLEIKYKAKFNQDTGAFKPKKKGVK